MPWWSLPESIRSANELLLLRTKNETQILEIRRKAFVAMAENYVQKNGFCCQKLQLSRRNQQGYSCCPGC